MRIVMPGGSGQVGRVLCRGLRKLGHQVDVIGRSVNDPKLRWDGRNDGPWMQAIDGADAVINLAGRSVNCRYHWRNLNEMMQSRVDSANAVGRAIEAAPHPPSLWLQASTASIYAHTLDTDHDEHTGCLGGHEPEVPAYWAYSVSVATAWELALEAAHTPNTRKVALRTGFAMSPDRGGIFDVLMWLVKRRLAGPFLGGKQFVSWIGDRDLVGMVQHLLHDESLTGPVNVTAPAPIANRDFMKVLRAAAGSKWSLPILPGMAEIGALYLKTDKELMQKSRRVVPSKLLDAGYVFELPTWEQAAPDLHKRWAAS